MEVSNKEIIALHKLLDATDNKGCLALNSGVRKKHGNYGQSNISFPKMPSPRVMEGHKASEEYDTSFVAAMTFSAWRAASVLSQDRGITQAPRLRTVNEGDEPRNTNSFDFELRARRSTVGQDVPTQTSLDVNVLGREKTGNENIYSAVCKYICIGVFAIAIMLIVLMVIVMALVLSSRGTRDLLRDGSITTL